MSATGDDGQGEIVTREQRLVAGTETVEAGSVRLRKEIDHAPVEQQVTSSTEGATVERLEPEEGDSGQIETLPDGSISVPLFEERLVVEKKLFVRERIIIRKQVTVEDHTVTADLARERLVVDVDDAIADRVVDARSTGAG